MRCSPQVPPIQPSLLHILEDVWGLHGGWGSVHTWILFKHLEVRIIRGSTVGRWTIGSRGGRFQTRTQFLFFWRSARQSGRRASCQEPWFQPSKQRLSIICTANRSLWESNCGIRRQFAKSQMLRKAEAVSQGAAFCPAIRSPTCLQSSSLRFQGVSKGSSVSGC